MKGKSERCLTRDRDYSFVSAAMVDQAPQSFERLIVRAEACEKSGALLEAVDALRAAYRVRPSSALAWRLVRLRRTAFAEIADAAVRRPAVWQPPVAAPAPAVEPSGVDPSKLDPAVLRRHLGCWGCLLVRRLVPPEGIDRLVHAIDASFRECDSCARGGIEADPNATLLEIPDGATVRRWVRKTNGVLAIDAPEALEMLLETYAQVGAERLLLDYFGERPVLAAEKCTLRRTAPSPIGGWHQDGAFLGAEVRALNLWIALTDCGVDAPGLDVVPRRFTTLLPTGTHNAALPWIIADDVISGEAQLPIWRPRFRAGDALLFDHLLPHQTATSPSMTCTRYAIESWFFAPSAYPANQTPIVA